MFNLKSDSWFGDEASYQEALALEARVEAMVKAGTLSAEARQGPGAGGAQDAMPRLYSRAGGVGMVTVRGPLINTDNWFTEALGISTYPAIRAALAFGATDPQVSQLMLDIESPGGQVSGTNDVAKLLKTVDATMKPVTAFSDSMVASAAYWIASGARELHVGETAIVGSIGVVATMVSQAEALKKEGIQVTVVRAGKNKMLGHPAEPTSDAAIAKTQTQVNALYDIFTAAVSANRSELPMKKVDSWANGNEFLGADAVDAGLADSVSTFDQTYAKLVQNVDASKTSNNNANKTRGMQMKPRATLDPTVIAAQAGIELTDVKAAEAAALAAADAEAKVAAEAAAAAKAEADAAAAAKAEADAATAAAAAASKAESELVTFLRAELKTAQDSVTALTVEKAALTAKVDDSGASYEKLCVIARNSVNTMTVALGGHKASLENLSGLELVARHAAVCADFVKAFPVGGVASTNVDEDNKEAAAAAPARHLKLVAAVGLSTNKKK